MNSKEILRMEHIHKSFPGVKALQDVSFDLQEGEVHALVGENGAGKSTLMKILGGVYIPEEGQIVIDNEAIRLKNPSEAILHGISVIYQEFNLIPTLSVAENIFLGKEYIKSHSTTLDRKMMNKDAAAVMTKLGLPHFDCARLVRNLSVAQQQMVEIAKAVFNNARILVMDEPSAVLSQTETDLLFTLIRDLKKKGITIIYISHRLTEILELSDRITVLRDGQFVITYNNHEGNITEDDLINKMVGRDISDIYPDRSDVKIGETIFEVTHISHKGLFHDISFSLHKGEILGFSGLVGAGRTEVMKALFGYYPIDEGEISINGQSVKIRSIHDAIDQGIALVPEDRKREGLILRLTAAQNMILAGIGSVQQFGVLLKKSVKHLVDQYIRKLDIRPAIPNRTVDNFSGGNQQKVVIAKWLATHPRIIILDEPTRGVDVGAKVEIYKLIDELARSGLGVIFVSSEQLEILGMCDRILVLHNGEISGEFTKDSATEELLLAAAAGLNKRFA
jgi:ribose transport system ATP-binding protein